MRRRVVFLLLTIAAAVVVAWFATGGAGGSRSAAGPTVYFGWLLGTTDVTAVAVDVRPSGTSGRQTVTAYVCDALGPPTGKSVWFKADVSTRRANTGGVTLTSAGRREKLRVTLLSRYGVLGSFTDARGRVGQFSSYRAIDGAGIYEVTLDQSLHYTGTSTDGNKLDAQSDKAGVTRGTIRAHGKKISFRVRSLALAPLAVLKSHGHSTVYKRFARLNQVPGEYVAVIAPGGSYWLGRSGNVRTGRSGVFIIGLDKKEAIG